MDRPAADPGHDRVAGLLEAQPVLDRRAVIARPARARSDSRGSRAGGAGRRGARGSRSTRRSTGAGAARTVAGSTSTPNAASKACTARHLVGDRADAADARHDVDDLVRRPADDQPLEVARRLEDLQAGRLDGAVADAQVERALALDARQVADVDRQVGAAGRDDRVMHRTAPRRPRRRSGRAARPRRR